MRILIIEDEVKIINFLKPNLEAEFYIVDTATDGEQGSFLARTNDYDLIILDYVLPKMDGLEVCKEIKKDKKNVPIIMLTIKSELDTKIKLFEQGVDDYLTKPFLFEELTARIKAVLKRPNKVDSKILRIDDLSVNLYSHIVKRCGKEIYLTRKEFCLLEYFIRNKGKLLSRALILEHVWDMNADPFSNTIEAHVLNLRKKINPNKKRRDLIHTIPSRGYKMELKR